jgi:hypothetical protein
MAKKASYRTAIHEAGHAVIGRVLTLSCGHATIKPNRHFGGHVIIEDQYFCAEEWDKRGKLRGNNAGWHAQISASWPAAKPTA